jgi:CheY-like chemotaxis protein
MDSLRILCVDDDASFRGMLKLMLERHGFAIVTASHGIDALMQYKAHHGNFSCVLSDHDMPLMNGLEFVRSLRESGYQGRIIVMSGRLGAQELYAYQPHRVSGFFSKPFDIGMLATLLLQLGVEV